MEQVNSLALTPHPNSVAVSKSFWIPAAVTMTAWILVMQVSRALFFSAGVSPAVILTGAGVALAALTLYGVRLWPAITVAAIINGFIASAPIVMILASAAGITIQAVLSFYALKFFGFNPRFERLKDVLVLMLVGIFTPTISPAVNLAVHALSGTASQTTWGMHWLLGLHRTVAWVALVAALLYGGAAWMERKSAS